MKKFLAALFVVAGTSLCFAPPTTPTDPADPIDGGIALLVAAGVAFGAKKAYERKKAV